MQYIAAEGSEQPSVLLWNSAVALSWAWWAGRLPPPRNARVLDLGAGLGVCSLTAAALDAKVVVATEIEPALTALRASVLRNADSRGSGCISCVELCWGAGCEAAQLGDFDFVIGTDIIYATSLHAPLMATLRHVLTEGTVLLLAYEERSDAEAAFLDALSSELGVDGASHELHEPTLKVFVGTVSAREAPAAAHTPPPAAAVPPPPSSWSASRQPSSSWWHTLSAHDPISLEPLSSLPYPPFELKADLENSTDGDWCDGRLLAIYLTTSQRFTHPTSRRELTRDECAALDVHLRRCRVSDGISEVAKVFDTAKANEAAGRSSSPAAAVSTAAWPPLRREHERALTEALYRGGSTAVAPPGQRPRPQVGVRNNRHTRAGRAAAREAAAASGPSRNERAAAAVLRDGNMAIIDDDQIPSHGRQDGSARHGSVVTAADYGEWPEMPAQPVERFPALPTPAAPRPITAPSVPAQVAAATAARVAAREAAAAEAAAAAEDAAAAAVAMRLNAREERARLLAAARANGSDDESLVMQELLTSLAADASKAFSAEALSLAKSHPSLVAEIERAFDLLIASGDRNKTAAAHQRVSLRPMPRQHRRLVHELSHIYHIGTIAQGTEPQRYINLLRTDLTAWPDCTLSEAAEMAAAVARGDMSAPASAPKSAAAQAGWPIKLYQIECDERLVSQMLAAHKQDYSIQWNPQMRRERQAAREGMRLSATLTFSSESSARGVMQAIGGGLRGRFRVEKPWWASGGGNAAPSTAAATVVVLSLAYDPCSGRVKASLQAADANQDDATSQPQQQPPRASRASRNRSAKSAATAWSDGGGSGSAASSSPFSASLWTAAHEPLASMLSEMGFGENASKRASLKVGVSGEMEGRLAEAMDWLMSQPEGVDEPLVEEAKRPVVANPHKHAGPLQVAKNPWAALGGEDSDSD